MMLLLAWHFGSEARKPSLKFFYERVVNYPGGTKLKKYISSVLRPSRGIPLPLSGNRLRSGIN